MNFVLQHWQWFAGGLAFVILGLFWQKVLGIVMIPQDSIGVVNKKFTLGANKDLPSGSIIALKGEAGYQADTLAPGIHFGLWFWQYQVAKVKFIEIPTGHMGVVVARDGAALVDRINARHVECGSFQDARMFLENGGQRGRQISVMRPGTYRINNSLFEVAIEECIDIPDTQVGVVTTMDGVDLPGGAIAAWEIVAGHDSFQNGQAFLDNKGYRGLQVPILTAGRYYINPYFASIELFDLTEIPIAHVGVVISYAGANGVDVSGEGFKHGNLVSNDQKGVWANPLDPGKHPINPRTNKVVNVPTANVVLNWAKGKSESHKLDERLSTITVRSSDGFTYNLDVSQIIHIPRSDASKVIARFGSVENLVTQVLEPTIGNYFRNAAQDSDVIEFLKDRQNRQNQARAAISNALAEYNVGAVDTLIGDIVPPPELMKTLTDRKLAEQLTLTYNEQQISQEARTKFEQASAIASTQAHVVDAERSVQVAEFTASATVKKAEGDAKAKTLIALADKSVVVTTAEGAAAQTKLYSEAEALKITVIGQAESEKILKIGSAEAKVIEQKIQSMTSDGYTQIEVSRNLSQSKQAIVPTIVAGGSQGGGGNLMDVVLAQMIAKSNPVVDKHVPDVVD